MAQKIQDIKSNKTNIITALRDEKMGYKTSPIVPVEQPAGRISSTPRLKERKPVFRKPIGYILASALIVLISYWVLVFFEHASVVIEAKHQTFDLQGNQFSASKEPNAPIHFEIMVISDTGYKDMVLTDGQQVSLKAAGQVTLYNEFSTAPQKLVVTTRLADEKGRAYTTDSAVTIPGYTLDKDKKIVPGTVNVGIHAFLPGDTYNADPKDLTITGFKGSAKFSKIYAKATAPVEGGAVGLAYALSPEQKGTLESFAASSFKSNLLKKISAQVPAGYILYQDALSFSYTTKANTLYPAPNAKVEVTGTVSAVLLEKKGISEAIVKYFLPEAQSAEINQIELAGLDTLSFSFLSQGQAVTKEMQSSSFTLSGQINALWHPDVVSIKQDLIGIERTLASSVFAKDKGVENASMKVFPPWQKKLPIDEKKITITVE